MEQCLRGQGSSSNWIPQLKFKFGPSDRLPVSVLDIKPKRLNVDDILIFPMIPTSKRPKYGEFPAQLLSILQPSESSYQDVTKCVQTTIIITFPIHLRTTRLGSICLLSNAGWITGICTTKLSASYRDTLAGFASLKSWIISPLQTEWVNSCMNYSFNQHNLSEVCIKIRMGIPVLNIKISKCGAM